MINYDSDLNYEIYLSAQRGKRYEVRVAAFDKNKPVSGDHPDSEFGYQLAFKFSCYFDAEPDAEALNSEIARKIEIFKAKMLEPPEKPPRMYDEKEVAALLVEKGLLSDGETVEDLKTLAELTAIEEVR